MTMTLVQMADELLAIIEGERPRLNKTEMREYVRDLFAANAAHLTQPAQSMDVDMVERACVAHYESWSVFHQWEREAFRRDMKHALTAALQEKGNGSL